MRIFSKKKTIYTACFGDYDERRDSADIYFDESNNPFDGSSEHLSPRFMGKVYKVLNPFSYDIWIDASVEIKNRRKFEKLFKGELSVFKHPFNKTIKDELDLCHKIGYVNDTQKENIIKLYESSNLNMEEIPVYACTIIYHTKKTQGLSRFWWSLICQYSYRDQLTFPYTIKQFPNLDFRVIDLDIYNNNIFKVHKHKNL
jgi:hypothetical protein